MTSPSSTPDPVVAELVERACFSWLRSLFPVQASDDEIRSRIKDTDRQHVGYILVSSGIVAQLTALAERVAVKDATLERIAIAVGQYREAPFRSADWLAAEVVDAFEAREPLHEPEVDLAKARGAQ